MEPIELSIIVPCYNVASFVRPCLDSLLAQTLQSVEIIAINDGSTDETLAILKEYAQANPNRIIVVDQKNAGVWHARLAGIGAARGAFIGFLDGDDTAEPTFAEHLIAATKAREVDIVVCGFSRIDAVTDKILSREYCKPRSEFTVANEPGRIVELNGALWNKIFRADLLKDSTSIENPPVVLEDLILGLLAYTRTTGKITFVPEPLVNYRVRSNSAMATTTPEKAANAREALRQIRRSYEDRDIGFETIQAIDALAFLHLGVSLPFRLSYGGNAEFKDALRETTQFLNNYFPTWSHSPYISLSYAQSHGSTFMKLLLAQLLYKAHLMGPALGIYRFIIEKMQIDIKW